MLIRLIVNGTPQQVRVAPTTRLLEVLRDQLCLTAAKRACGRGDCSACTVLVGDRGLNSCLVLAARVTEPVRTAEGLRDDALALREAFAEKGGLQCGYCTPAMIVRAYELISRSAGAARPDTFDDGTASLVDADQIRRELAGNFCRCTGYNGIVDAIVAAAKTMGATANSTQRHNINSPRSDTPLTDLTATSPSTAPSN